MKMIFMLMLLICQVLSHTIELTGNSIDCYFETLSIEDEMTITYQVSGGGHLDINFILYNPDQSTITNHDHQNTGSHSFKATSNGIYKYCFDNSFSSITTKTISFNVHGIIYVEDDGHTAPIEKEIKALSQALEAVKDEQEYVVIRERLHRNTAESTNNRVKIWSIIQTIMLISVCVWQVFYLKRFFEVKRVL